LNPESSETAPGFTLERPDIAPDSEIVDRYIRGQRIMVTGAGGSIGSELCRQIADCAPESLMLLGRGENSIFEIDRDLAEAANADSHRTVIADVRDRSKLERVFAECRPDVVFHTAAHKHVPLMEQHVDEAVKNNIFGTANVAQISLQYEVSTFVLISSDKAINPTSVYGATKKAAEYIVQDLAGADKTKFVVVRFGNVIRSRGSIIPIFERQILNGGPVTVTHPEMQRFFMSIPEAAYLVLQSGGIALSGQVCVLDMGDPVKIIELVHHLIEKAGLRPGLDIKIEMTGSRPGEKIVEELVLAESKLIPTRWEKILLDEPDSIDSGLLHRALQELSAQVEMGDRETILEGLRALVPSYNSIGVGAG
jgi:FlaA1/EpsC-like NDP-sugar epimerase